MSLEATTLCQYVSIIPRDIKSSDRLPNIGACNTASSPLNISPTNEAIVPLIYAAISATYSDDRQGAIAANGDKG